MSSEIKNWKNGCGEIVSMKSVRTVRNEKFCGFGFGARNVDNFKTSRFILRISFSLFCLLMRQELKNQCTYSLNVDEFIHEFPM